MNKISSNIRCPSCHGQLRPKILICENCELTVEGPFQFNEFATLSPEDLHFLRIFIQSEGRIRDMEPALGLSYPTIRSRLSELKNKLSNQLLENEQSETKTKAQKTLELLESGKISFEEALAEIKKTKKSGKDTRST